MVYNVTGKGRTDSGVILESFFANDAAQRFQPRTLFLRGDTFLFSGTRGLGCATRLGRHRCLPNQLDQARPRIRAILFLGAKARRVNDQHTIRVHPPAGKLQ